MKNLEGRVVIVTGGSGGIGIVVSELIANRGAHVVLAELDGVAVQQAIAALREQVQVQAVLAEHAALAAALDARVLHAEEAAARHHRRVQTHRARRRSRRERGARHLREVVAGDEYRPTEVDHLGRQQPCIWRHFGGASPSPRATALFRASATLAAATPAAPP